MVKGWWRTSRPCTIVVSIPACHAVSLVPIPATAKFDFFFTSTFFPRNKVCGTLLFFFILVIFSFSNEYYSDVLRQAKLDPYFLLGILPRIHSYPELQLEERNTSDLIHSYLDLLKIPYSFPVGSIGVIADVDSGRFPSRTSCQHGRLRPRGSRASLAFI